MGDRKAKKQKTDKEEADKVARQEEMERAAQQAYSNPNLNPNPNYYRLKMPESGWKRRQRKTWRPTLTQELSNPNNYTVVLPSLLPSLLPYCHHYCHHFIIL